MTTPDVTALTLKAVAEAVGDRVHALYNGDLTADYPGISVTIREHHDHAEEYSLMVDLVIDGLARLRDGNEVLIISSGFMTMRALEVAQQLEADKVGVAVLHCPTIKPLDEATILAEVARPGRLVVVAENHSVIGGLGEAVAGLLLREGVIPSKFRMLGLPDAFLDAGALPTLHDRYGISVEKMTGTLKAWLA